jgi:DnaJ-class molecular chaperone
MGDKTGIETFYRNAAKTMHPDKGGGEAEFAALVAWRDKALRGK